MGYGLDDIFSGDALGGFASGAAAGASAGGLPGAIIGGGLGVGIGSYSHYKRDQAASKQKSALDQIMANMRSMSNNNYKQHVADLRKTLNYFAPAQQVYNQFWGSSAPAQTGLGSWGNTGV